MNPLHWKHEHQIALACAALLGAGISLFLAWQGVHPRGHWQFIELCQCAVNFYWLIVFACSLAGAAVGAVLVYIAKLLWVPESV